MTHDTGEKTIEKMCLMTLLGVCWVYATNHMRCLLHKFVNLNIDQKLYIESILAWQYIDSHPSPSAALGWPGLLRLQGWENQFESWYMAHKPKYD